VVNKYREVEESMVEGEGLRVECGGNGRNRWHLPAAPDRPDPARAHGPGIARTYPPGRTQSARNRRPGGPAPLPGTSLGPRVGEGPGMRAGLPPACCPAPGKPWDASRGWSERDGPTPALTRPSPARGRRSSCERAGAWGAAVGERRADSLCPSIRSLDPQPSTLNSVCSPGSAPDLTGRRRPW
jgi:hypothetical protein